MPRISLAKWTGVSSTLFSKKTIRCSKTFRNQCPVLPISPGSVEGISPDFVFARVVSCVSLGKLDPEGHWPTLAELFRTTRLGPVVGPRAITYDGDFTRRTRNGMPCSFFGKFDGLTAMWAVTFDIFFFFHRGPYDRPILWRSIERNLTLRSCIPRRVFRCSENRKARRIYTQMVKPFGDARPWPDGCPACRVLFCKAALRHLCFAFLAGRFPALNFDGYVAPMELG